MKKFLKSMDNTHQIYKLFIFYILNLWDILFTQFFIFKMPDLFVEVNPFLKPIINDSPALLLKIIIPLLISLYWSKRYMNSQDKNKKRANNVLNCIILVFIIINALHMFNMYLYISL